MFSHRIIDLGHICTKSCSWATLLARIQKLTLLNILRVEHFVFLTVPSKSNSLLFFILVCDLQPPTFQSFVLDSLLYDFCKSLRAYFTLLIICKHSKLSFYHKLLTLHLIDLGSLRYLQRFNSLHTLSTLVKSLSWFQIQSSREIA